MDVKMNKDKSGQVTIFIIVAILLVSIIALFFLFRGGIGSGSNVSEEENINLFLKSCIENKVEEGIEILSLQGGSIENPLNKTFKFEDETMSNDISYLCYVKEENEFCINQESMLLNHVEEEIKNYIDADLEKCFTDLAENLREEGAEVTYDYNNFEVSLKEDRVLINLDAEIAFTKAGEVITKKNFEMFTKSGIYDLLIVVYDIINQEAKSCDFNYGLFVKNYPEFDIEKIRTSNSDIIYKVSKDNEDFRFAVRGCVTSL